MTIGLQLVGIKLKSYALVFTISICLIISLLCLAALMLLEFNLYIYDNTYLIEKNSKNFRDGINWALKNIEKLRPEEIFHIIISDSEKIDLKLTDHGVFRVISVCSILKKDTISRSFIVGYRSSKDKPTIFIPKKDNRLSLIGKNEFCGRLTIPKGQFKIESLPNVLNSNLDYNCAKVFTSTTELPQILNWFNLQNSLNKKGVKNLSYRAKKMHQSFIDSTMKFKINEPLVFDSKIDFYGNVIIESNSTVVINNGSKLENVVIFAPYIRVESGFEGSLQLFATDSIVISANVKMNYPSALLLTNSRSSIHPKIFIGEHSSLEGILYCDQRNAVIIGEKGSKMLGTLYNMGKTNIETQIEGSLFAESLIRNYRGVAYKDFFIDNVINSIDLNEHFLECEQFFGTERPNILKWVD